MMTRKRARQGYGEGDEGTTSGDVAAGGGPHGQLTYANEVLSSKYNPVAQSWLSPMMRNSVVYYFGRLTKYALNKGAINLGYQLKHRNWAGGAPVGTVAVPGTSGANTIEYPLHIYNCTARRYGALDAIVGHFMYADNDQSTSAGMVKFGALTGLSNDGTTVINRPVVWSSSDAVSYQAFEGSGSGALDARTIRRSIVPYIKAELLLQGSKTAPTTFHIDFVRFRQDYLAPHVGASKERDEFYLKLVKSLLGNPISHSSRAFSTNRDVEVLASRVYYIAPDSTDNADTAAPCKHVTIMFNAHQPVNWAYKPVVGSLGRGAVTDPNVWVPGIPIGDASVNSWSPPDVRDRVFMIVRASNSNFDVNDGNEIPQYDLALRWKHSFMTVG